MLLKHGKRRGQFTFPVTENSHSYAVTAHLVEVVLQSKRMFRGSF